MPQLFPARRAVAAIVGRVAARLVGEQVDAYIVVHRVLEQVHDVAVKGDGSDLPLAHQLMGSAERLRGRLRDLLDPALTVPRRDAGFVHLRRDGDAARDVRRLEIGRAHV